MQKRQVKKYSIQNAQKCLPIRRRTDNKTRGGKCIVIAGSKGQWGAAILCAEAAARVGAGYVYLYDPQGKFPFGKNPDFLTIQKEKDPTLFHSVAIGPGLKSSTLILNKIKTLIQKKYQPVVLDAEALNVISEHPIRFALLKSWILTPHEGELSRLLQVSSETIRQNRQKYARLAQEKLGCIIVLKGHRTLIASAGELWEVLSGNSSLAKAGTGDVLTGMIAGFLSQGVKPIEAAKLAVFIHGYISDQWIAEGHDQLSLMASDLIKWLPTGLSKIRNFSK